MSSYSNQIQGYSKSLKKRMIVSRLFGIFGCCVGIASIVLYSFYKETTHWQWLCLIMMTYSLGMIFMQNCNLQAVKVGNPWQRVNGLCAILLFALDVMLITYALTTGKIILW